MMRTLLLLATCLGVTAPLSAQRDGVVHYGKWLTAGATVAFTVFAAREHRSSRGDWDALLAICRSTQRACEVGTDGRYLRSDAEQLYERSRVFDRRANRRLLGAQLSLLATATLFILDLHPGRAGPDNIPFSPLRVTLEPTGDGAAVGLQLRF
jgi:hypothetical protein